MAVRRHRRRPGADYPWGPDWDPGQEPWRANTTESELGRSTAVGMYPAGASPAGVFDMAGTVWEWCLNAFDDPDNTAFPTSQEDRRVLRGGSWIYRSGLRALGHPHQEQPERPVRLRRLSCGVFVPIMTSDH